MQRKRHWFRRAAAVAAMVLFLQTSGCSSDVQSLAYDFMTALVQAFASALTSTSTTS